MKEEETQLLVDHFSGLLFLMREEGDFDFFTSLVNICKHESNIHRWLARLRFNLSSSHLSFNIMFEGHYAWDTNEITLSILFWCDMILFRQSCILWRAMRASHERKGWVEKISKSKVSCLNKWSQGDCGHLDCQHHPCCAHGYSLQSVCGYHF